MMRVALGHRNVLVTEQLLHLVKVYTVLNEPRREGVAQIVEMRGQAKPNPLKTTGDKKAPRAGLEPATYWLTASRYCRLSYRGIK